MPIIKTDSCYYDGPFKRTVRFAKKDGFTCELPPAAWAVVGTQKAVSNTLDGCLREFERLVKAWRSASSTTREVLVYQVHRKAHICESGKNTDDALRKYIFRADDLGFEEGMGLTVCAGVFVETKIQLGGDVRYEYKLINGRLPLSIEHGAGGHHGLISGCGKYQQGAMLTTPELEAFFTGIALGLEKLILMFDQLRDEKKLLTFAAEGLKLLAPPSEPVIEKTLPEGS